MKIPQSQVQLGKNKVSENFIETLRNHFKKHENVKIVILKSAGHTKQDVKKYNEQILASLGKRYTSKIVGFTIFIKKWRKARR